MFNMHSAFLIKWNQFLFLFLILTRDFVMNEKRKSVDFRNLKDLVKCSQNMEQGLALNRQCTAKI